MFGLFATNRRKKLTWDPKYSYDEIFINECIEIKVLLSSNLLELHVER